LHCRQCGKTVRKDSPEQIWTHANKSPAKAWLITFQLPLSEKLSLADSLELITRQGYQRIVLGKEILRIEEAGEKLQKLPHPHLTVVQDRLTAGSTSRARFVEACEQAYHFGKGRLSLWSLSDGSTLPETAELFSNRLHCAQCDIEYRDPTPALFSFNHPIGACPSCKGFGRIISIDYNLALPDTSKTIAGGVVRPWQTGVSADCQTDLLKFCKQRHIPTDVPFAEMSEEHRTLVIDGEPDHGKDEDHEWPKSWYGVKGYFRWLESKSYKMHVRVLLSRYRSYQKCHTCNGARFQPETLLYRIDWSEGKRTGMTLSDFYGMPIRDARNWVESLVKQRPKSGRDPLEIVLGEVRSRLQYLVDAGLGYLTLDRTTRTLSGGETERVNLTTCLGTRLVNTLFVLDEPSVGLHARDTERLVNILEQLRDTGNTVVIVEHESAVMRAADQLIDLGPGQGEHGGDIQFQGDFAGILKSEKSLTGQYLSGRRQIEIPARRMVESGKGQWLKLSNATRHNLDNLSTEIPLARLVAITGVSGSGKTTLIREILMPALDARFQKAGKPVSSAGDSDEDDDENTVDGVVPVRLTGWESLAGAVLVDQSALGKTPRSNPAVYIGAFDDLREIFAHTELAKQRGLNASAFSFNSAQGQCERCRGAGFEKIEMQFLSDVFVRCPDCDGRRYRGHILEVIVPGNVTRNGKITPVEWNVADLLAATVEESLEFLASLGESKPALRAAKGLRLLMDVGLGYLRLGQPINTLSGGESQRLKLVGHLAEF
ncbi:MAG TPA: excinuclease ABC subunit A, partial [Roseimicrobium sp.]|nr:excinuclease ABC subunit A [Roseimicrobium sp.]